MIEHPTLYQVDSKGKLRFWRMEDGYGKYRTVSGVVGGKEVVSGWVLASAKNVGRSNETTSSQQATLEIEADYKLKRDKKYYDSIEEAQAAGSGTKFLSPMLAQKWDDYKDKVSGPVFVQPKLDGIRATITKDGMLSRAGKPIVACPHITEALTEWFDMFPGVALDGELYNHELKHDFDTLTSLVKKQKPTTADLIMSDNMIQFHCYDIIMDGPFRERLQFRDENLDHHYCIKHVETHFAYKDEVDELHAKFIGEGYEGSMIRLDAPYESKRSKSLMKRKDFFDAEFEIDSFLEGQGDWAGSVKMIHFKMPDGRVGDDGELPKASCRGSRDFLRGLWFAVQVNEGLDFLGLDPMGKRPLPTHATIRYPNLTPRGFPRFGVVTQWHYNGKREY